MRHPHDRRLAKRAYEKGGLLAEQAGALVRIALLEAATLAVGVRRAEDRRIALAEALRRIADAAVALIRRVRIALLAVVAAPVAAEVLQCQRELDRVRLEPRAAVRDALRLHPDDQGERR